MEIEIFVSFVLIDSRFLFVTHCIRNRGKKERNYKKPRALQLLGNLLLSTLHKKTLKLFGSLKNSNCTISAFGKPIAIIVKRHINWILSHSALMMSVSMALCTMVEVVNRVDHHMPISRGKAQRTLHSGPFINMSHKKLHTSATHRFWVECKSDLKLVKSRRDGPILKK